jgi:hypothetical protein
MCSSLELGDCAIKDVSESLQLFLTPAAPAQTRRLALRLIGCKWIVWEKYFNPVTVVDTISNMLQEAGYTTKDDAIVSENGQADDAIIDECFQCVQNIAMQNAMLVFSALVVKVNKPGGNLDGRIAALKLLTHLISVDGLPTKDHLPSIVGACVRSLSPNEEDARKMSEVSGTSLMTESTQFLAAAMSRYYQLMAFHKGQQLLAVAHTSANALVTLIYDLRTGNPAYSLGVNLGSDIVVGAQLENIAFSINGKALAGVAIDMTQEYNKWIVVWKLPSKLQSLLSTLPTSLPTRSSSVSGTASPEDRQESNIGESSIHPRKIVKVKFDGEAVLEWIDDNILQIGGSNTRVSL